MNQRKSLSNSKVAIVLTMCLGCILNASQCVIGEKDPDDNGEDSETGDVNSGKGGNGDANSGKGGNGSDNSGKGGNGSDNSGKGGSGNDNSGKGKGGANGDSSLQEWVGTWSQGVGRGNCGFITSYTFASDGTFTENFVSTCDWSYGRTCNCNDYVGSYSVSGDVAHIDITNRKAGSSSSDVVEACSLQSNWDGYWANEQYNYSFGSDSNGNYLELQRVRYESADKLNEELGEPEKYYWVE